MRNEEYVFAAVAEAYFTGKPVERCISILKSVKTESNRVQFWVREFGNRPLGQISGAGLQDWQARKRQTSKPATANRIMCRLRHTFNRAVDWELLDQSPLKGIKFLPENNARLRYLSREECNRLVESCVAPHLRAIVTVALHTGMRSGEIRSLQWNDLDFDSGFIIIRDSKNGEPRHVPMDSTVVASQTMSRRSTHASRPVSDAVLKQLGQVDQRIGRALALDYR